MDHVRNQELRALFAAMAGVLTGATAMALVLWLAR